MPTAILYEEPSHASLLVLTSLFVAINIARYAFDLLGHIGILGELAVGIIWGAPLADWIESEVQLSLAELGYLGLLAIVYHGGLTTNLQQAKRTLGLAFFAAATGMIAPIGLSFLLLHVAYGYNLLASFAAGAALASTSLGTSLAALTSAKVDGTRVGALLLSTALVDDVVALVLLQLIVSLASSADTDGIGWLVARPIVASIGLIAGAFVLARYTLRPLFSRVRPRLPVALATPFDLLFLALTALGGVAAAMYAGTSALLGAFTAGIVLAYLDASSPVPHFQQTFAMHLAQALDYVFAPLFFTSIGFAIPIRRMFDGETVWRGFVYAGLMLVGKLLVGIWIPIAHACRYYLTERTRRREAAAAASAAKTVEKDEASQREDANADLPAETPADPAIEPSASPTSIQPPADASSFSESNVKPSLWLPTLLLGSAMVARGEIGLIILTASLSSGALPDSLFLLGVWAVLLNTLVGPIGVGVLARRARGGRMPSEWA